MKKIVKLTESDLVRLVERVISEQMFENQTGNPDESKIVDYVRKKWGLSGYDGLEQNSAYLSLTNKNGDELKFNIQKGIIELEKNFGIDPKPIPMKTNFIEFKKWFDSNSRVINEQVKTLTLGSKGGAMINPGGNRPGHFDFVVKKVLGKNKYMVTISKWEFGSEYAKVGDSGTLTVGNKDATLNINGQVIDQLLMD
jgi:hypothetical protein